MGPKNTRKTIRDVKRLAKKHGLDVEHNKSRGVGSHQSLIFCDRKTGEKAMIVIADHREISPGVQRNTLGYLAQLGTSVAQLAYEIVKIIFENN